MLTLRQDQPLQSRLSFSRFEPILIQNPSSTTIIMSLLQSLKAPRPTTERLTRHDNRRAVVLPLRLTMGSGEMIPAVVLNISPSGLLVLVDERASLTLPPPRCAHINGELFFEELEIPIFTLEVTRIERRKNHQLILGCKFVNLPPYTIRAIRAKMSALSSKAAAHKSR